MQRHFREQKKTICVKYFPIPCIFFVHTYFRLLKKTTVFLKDFTGLLFKSTLQKFCKVHRIRRQSIQSLTFEKIGKRRKTEKNIIINSLILSFLKHNCNNILNYVLYRQGVHINPIFDFSTFPEFLLYFLTKK